MRPPIAVAIAIAIASASLKLHDPPNLSSGESSSRCWSAEGRRGAGAGAGALSKYPRVGGRAGSTASVASRTGIELRDRALWRYGVMALWRAIAYSPEPSRVDSEAKISAASPSPSPLPSRKSWRRLNEPTESCACAVLCCVTPTRAGVPAKPAEL